MKEKLKKQKQLVKRFLKKNGLQVVKTKVCSVFMNGFKIRMRVKIKKINLGFFYFYLKEKRNQKISHLNYRTYLVWDTHFTQLKEPFLSDLFLYLPEHKKYLKIVQDVLFLNYFGLVLGRIGKINYP